MNNQLKKTAIIALIFAVMVGMIPANIAWAGRLWQTLPTAGPSPTNTSTSTSSPTSTQSPTATSISNISATSTFLPGTHAPATPIQGAPSATNPGSGATPVLPVNTEIATTVPTSASIQTTAVTQDPGKASATLPPGFVPTESTQSANQFVPVISSDNSAVNEANGEANLPVPLILVAGIILLIIIGAVLRIILRRNRKQG